MAANWQVGDVPKKDVFVIFFLKAFLQSEGFVGC